MSDQATEIEIGDLIRLRAYGDKVIVRRVVHIEDGVVVICRDEEYQAAQREGRQPVAVGFHKKYVLGPAE